MNKPMPVNPPELRSTIVAASTMPWQPTQFAGIEMKILYSDEEGRSTILFKMAPTPRSNRPTCSKARWKTRKDAVARATSCGGPAATSTSRMRRTARRFCPCSTARTGFSMGRSFLRPRLIEVRSP